MKRTASLGQERCGDVTALGKGHDANHVALATRRSRRGQYDPCGGFAIAAIRHMSVTASIAADARQGCPFCTRIVSSILGLVKYETGEIDEAAELIEESRKLGAECGMVDFPIAAFYTAARIAGARGQIAEAVAMLDDGLQPARAFSFGSLETINDRELQILKVLAQRSSNKHMARVLYLDVNTIKWHLKNIYRKLHVKNRTEAVRKALDRGLLYDKR